MYVHHLVAYALLCEVFDTSVFNTTARRVDVLVVLVDLRKQGDNVWSTRSTHDFLGKPKLWGDSL